MIHHTVGTLDGSCSRHDNNSRYGEDARVRTSPTKDDELEWPDSWMARSWNSNVV